ncbi:UDP-4-amino-4,6-dideoxy-N-acetyl-beta-L-altrosamine N-acetyltransferase [Helicobacter sp. 16-1353]|uniref:UDP-4-amino-4, 6-dideoxy-N-acetyl-beta-L-altrosamine N-acetyltransferase n=1 Tax=Helicobacter sp. 16-1353 TaxID=2004996 RepID=UPI000DCEA77B|nr:UDP-4-amino-4,6-dideoxy-N-acetyl-beta-L-altrosamine N-acetyltransferase [Helicobacter sp. 16-1353]RAX54628.1 UDP-4-amino-4,6-dideoxy-N-acetyl-beta-L-altrosamine N-acetyltransferase [Helicobacter sp. 16-1353]
MKNTFILDNISVINFIHLNEDDLLEILKMRNNPKISQWMLVDRQISRTEHFNFIENLKLQKKQIYFALKHMDMILGVISLTNIDLYNKNAFIGIYANPNLLQPNNKSKSVGHRIMKVLKYISFDELSLHIIFAKCLSTNMSALRFYEKEGFLKCGILPQSIKKADGFIDTILLSFKKD